jgi:hypothetical protein
MTQYPPPPPPQPSYPSPTPGPQPHRADSPWWRRGWVIGVAALIVGIGLGAASAGSAKDKASAAPTVTTTATTLATTTVSAVETVSETATVTGHPRQVIATRTKTQTVTFTPKPKPAITDGTYKVGTDITSGEWHTTGGSNCYFEVDRDANAQDIVTNGDSTGPQFASLTDGEYFTTSGGCDWRHT